MNTAADKFRGLEQIPIRALCFGHEHPDGDFNMRKRGREDGRDEMARSILNEGYLQNLVATTRAGDHLLYVVCGNRRLLGGRIAIEKYPHEVSRAEIAPVRVYENLTIDEALALAAVEDAYHVPPHIVDRYEAFAPLAEKEGATPEDIAVRFGTTARIVEQALALSRVSPKIRDAWREGILDAATAACFTRAAEWKQQNKIFEKLKKDGHLFPNIVKAEISPSGDAARRFLRFVGVEAYEAAGGALVRDFFEGEHTILNPALVKELTDKKLEQAVHDLEFDGKWKWAAVAQNLPAEWRGWPKIAAAPVYACDEQARLKALEKILTAAEEETPETEAAEEESARIESAASMRGYTPAQRAECGVVVDLTVHGELLLLPGIRKPKREAEKPKSEKTPDTKATAASPGAPGKAATEPKSAMERDEPATLSAAKRIDLGIALTKAAAETLAGDPHLAKAVLLAGFAASGDPIGPIRASVARGLGARELRLAESEHPGANVRRFAKMDGKVLDILLAQAAGAALAFNYFSGAHALADSDIAAIVGALVPIKFKAAMLRGFDAEDYFRAAPKALVLKAIAESVGADEARRQAAKSKGDLVKYALTNVPRTGWLPIELRAAHYDGPPKAVKHAAPGKAATKPPAKKPAKKGSRK